MAKKKYEREGDENSKIIPPYLPKEIEKNLKAEKARTRLDVSQIDPKLLLGRLNMTNEVKLEKLCIGRKKDESNLEIKVNVPEFGVYEKRPDLSFTAVGKEDFVIDPDAFVELPPFRPDHLAFQPTPPKLPKSFKTIKNVFDIFPDPKQNYATTVFGTDNRRLFRDSSYPWGCCGKVRTALGAGSGVMIGPRHLLTVSHVVQWNSDGSAGWINFTPAEFDSSGPFGTANGTRIYYRRKVTGPTLNRDEMQHDYVVVVLDRRMGEVTGWLGSKSWSDGWDNEPYWAHVGYPGDLNSGARPSYQGSIPLDGSFWDRERHTRIFHQGDVWPGQSGGPFFAWWSNGPHAVAVQSAQNSSENTASGGSEMVDLVIRARNEYP